MSGAMEMVDNCCGFIIAQRLLVWGHRVLSLTMTDAMWLLNASFKAED